MDTDFEWEVRHANTPFFTHLIAGSCAGVSEHLFMLPFDNVKVKNSWNSDTLPGRQKGFA